jgi:DivIVA domain-containing protein
VTQESEPAFLYYRSPASIRETTFPHRLRGLDEEDVYAFLDLLADQVEAAEAERAALRADNERLRAQQSQDSPQEKDIDPRTEALFSEAQQVADRLVEEAVQHARDLMITARAQQREILQKAHEAAEASRRESAAGRAGGYGKPGPEVEYVRAFARVAQQLRSVLDALNDEVERLGELPRPGGDSRLDASLQTEIPQQPGPAQTGHTPPYLR